MTSPERSQSRARETTPLDAVLRSIHGIEQWLDARTAPIGELRQHFAVLRSTTDKVNEQRVPNHPANVGYMLQLGAMAWRCREKLARMRAETLASESSDAQAIRLAPPQWDVSRDPIVLLGQIPIEVVSALRRTGQERIVVVGDPRGSAPPHVRVVETYTDIRDAVTSFPGEAPERVTIRALGEVSAAGLGAATAAAQEGIDTARVYANTVHLFGETWVRHGMKNLPALALHPSVSVLGKAFVGWPIVLVAPGPSLAKQLPTLAQIQGRVVILAASHSLKALSRAGIVADFAMALDPEDLRYHFDGVPTVLMPGGLLLGATVNPGCYSLPGNIFHFAANPGIEGWLYEAFGELPTIRTGGSVATSMLALALSWQCDPIVLIGHDLGFTGGRVYARGGADEGATVVESGGALRISGYDSGYAAMESIAGALESPAIPLVKAPGYYGGQVTTCHAFNSFRQWIGRTAQESNARIWNCTEGGAHIDGVEQRALSYVEGCDGLDVAGTVAALVAQSRTCQIRAQSEYIAGLLRALRATRERATDAIRESYRAERDHSRSGRLGKLGQRLEREIAALPFIVLANLRWIKAADKQLFEGMTWTHAIKQARTSYSRIIELCDLFVGELHNGLRTLEEATRQRP